MKKDLVADIKARLSVEEVVGGYLDLKKSGDSYKALSPFKTEKTPSLIVTPAKEIWKDFSSGKGGSLFQFVMDYEGVDFKEALDILAVKAGLNLNDYRFQKGSSKKSQDLKQAIFKVLKIAADFYAEQFKKSVPARQYVKGRGFQAPVVREFQIGYAPDDWQSLSRYLESLKIPIKLAELAGLVKKRPIPQWVAIREKTDQKERWGDFFAERIMIPLSDTQGRIIGFTGRLLSDKEGVGKYVNSKQTILYNKSKHVFGYFQAMEAIRQEGFVLVVEGNLDVIACHQAGYKQTVAAGGTALTIDHLKIISRLTNDVRLAFDGDAAGTSAMERSLQSAQEAKVNLSIVSLPEGCDPDDLIKQNLGLWKKIVHDHQPAPEWLYEKYKEQLNFKTAEGKKHLTDVMLPIIGCLNDEVEKDHYLKKLEDLGISRKSLDKKLADLSGQKIKLPSLRQSPPTQPVEINDDERPVLPREGSDKILKIHLFLGLLLTEPELRLLSDKKDKRLEVILKEYKPEQELYKALRQSTDLVDNPDKLPDKLQAYKKCLRRSLNIVQTTEKGLYRQCSLDLKKKALSELFKQFDDLQTRLDINRKLNAA